MIDGLGELGVGKWYVLGFYGLCVERVYGKLMFLYWFVINMIFWLGLCVWYDE